MRRTVYNSQHLAALYAELGNLPHPFTVTIKVGRNRSIDQNALAWKWAGEIAAHFGDRTANEVHAENKLRFGVPIKRETDADFRRIYDARLKHYTYEQKLEFMAPPIDLPVTRDFKVKEMTRFLDDVRAYWTREGVYLTIPEWS